MTAHVLIHEIVAATCLLGAVTALCLTFYLACSLIRPERFEP